MRRGGVLTRHRSLRECHSFQLAVRSPDLSEANLSSLLSERLSAQHNSVLSDEANGIACDSASAGILSVSSRVGAKLVGHLSE